MRIQKGSSLARECTLGSKEAFLKKMDENEVLVLKGDNITLSTGCNRWPREKSRKLFIWWYWYIYIYIYIYYDGSQYKDIFYMKYLMIKYWWVTSYEFIIRIIYLKGLFSHPNVSEFHLLSYFTPFYFSLYKYIRWIIGVEILGSQQLRIICGTKDFIIIFMVLNIVLENYFEDVLFLVD